MAEEVKVVWFGAEVAAATHEAGASAVREALEYIGGKADAVTPVETGNLRESRRVDVDEAALEGVITYDAPYAEIVHEDPYPRHPVGEAKWLQKTMEQYSEAGLVIIRDRLAEVIR